jgi:hypothetical protein
MAESWFHIESIAVVICAGKMRKPANGSVTGRLDGPRRLEAAMQMAA